ncbi:ABC transporter ATP-binding protein [Bacillus sp. B190/17]|uniref:ABC transporter ATP-binding protein n=1 Tax=Bacillus lumedeiriae TaxID=3058829 RepID=A0ABW8I8I7_9BACI
MKKVLDVQNLHVSFETHIGEVKAVRGISFHLNKGETLAIVGESGSGKSVTTKALMRLIPHPPGRMREGKILFEGRDLVQLSEKEMETVRGKEISMIFQDPMTSLNPTMTIGRQLMEPLMKHQNMNKKTAEKRAIELLGLVGMPNPEGRMKQYPHQFSGGQRQRIVISIALACRPKILIADEPTTALDVTIQAQILELMKDLQKNLETSIIFITHDLGVVANIADRVAVMYGGQMVEIGTVDEVFYDSRHPYTWGLLSSMPRLNADERMELRTIPGTPPDLLQPPKGDAFALRSQYALNIDFQQEPPIYQVSPTHFVKSWLLHPDAPAFKPPANVQQSLRTMPNNFDKPRLFKEAH